MLKRLILAVVLLASPVLAVQPDEVLPDPVLESRARELAKVLRCPVCQGENIDESNASISRDLRLLVRDRLLAGDSDGEVLDYVVGRYGEYVLFEPDRSGANLILWLVGPGVLLVALGGAAVFIRSRRPTDGPTEPALSDDERARLAEILRE
ncbi:cytochrome C biogenesis protein CcdA [Rhodobacter veldkampii DSM 11550]|uniref:Cytochrome c-type biogenesis protein n=1 Tax=Phaeovulum veldkampii DSM 11550 TaxID=1185920 RepID=A0A2T4JMD6_9RHOB|nr:cytochrome c-type biogenesis protein [Phaeovulum veldkampii]MBK5946288.1 cytochrome C biogenesis protein CcdA [Phaeovulum veldkampii DSM 11550]PTE19069.1 cytochrome C biogenesis protein CcdA [Phaeovulum veldkampii DSM 11550]TDQ61380.1 cytochrome c-type biogenesis protein CcmH [Phaeovulum veldkampii DSM 11550]